jgi:RimJ/RimL family protein N-acetyltransferase
MLSVEPDNPRARALYERLGYVASGRRRVAWESQRADGTTFMYETEVTDLRKNLA